MLSLFTASMVFLARVSTESPQRSWHHAVSKSSKQPLLLHWQHKAALLLPVLTVGRCSMFWQQHTNACCSGRDISQAAGEDGAAPGVPGARQEQAMADAQAHAADSRARVHAGDPQASLRGGGLERHQVACAPSTYPHSARAFQVDVPRGNLHQLLTSCQRGAQSPDSWSQLGEEVLFPYTSMRQEIISSAALLLLLQPGSITSAHAGWMRRPTRRRSRCCRPS